MLTFQTCAERIPHFLFFFNDPAPPEIYPLSLHDALPISTRIPGAQQVKIYVTPTGQVMHTEPADLAARVEDRKSTRLNSSHVEISYAVFCLKKKNFPNLASLLIRLVDLLPLQLLRLSQAT